MIKKIRLNKSGVSEMVAYVMLIVIALTVSVGVYSFLKSYVWKPTEKCNDGVSLVIDQYWCDYAKKEINITFKNMGNFNIDGFWIRASNKSGGQAVVVLESGKTIDGKIYLTPPLAPGEIVNFAFPYLKFNKIEEINIQPLQIKKNLAACEDAVITQTIRNCGDAPPAPPQPPAPVIPLSLVSWWKFNELSGAIVAADSKDGNSAQLSGLADFVAGKIGNALNSQGGYFKVGTSTPSNLKFAGDFTIEALVNIKTLSDKNFIVGDYKVTEKQYTLQIDKDGKIVFYWNNGKLIETGNLITPGDWNYIAVIKLGGSFSVYLNSATALKTGTDTNALKTDPTDAFYIGQPSCSLIIDELAVYNSALDTAEIARHVQNEKAGRDYFTNAA